MVMQKVDDRTVTIDGAVISVDELHQQFKDLHAKYTKDKSYRQQYVDHVRLFIEAKKMTGYCPNCKKGKDGVKEMVAGKIRSGALKVSQSVKDELLEKLGGV